MEKIQKKSFWQVVKRLAEILKYKKVRNAYILLTATDLRSRFVEIFSIQIIAWVISAIEENNEQKIWFYIYLFIWSCIVTYWTRFVADIYFWRFTNWAELELSNEYLKKYIKLDNTKTEALWTGRMQSILFSWIRWWRDLVLRNWVPILWNIWWILYIIIIVFFQLPIVKAFLFLFLFWLISIFLSKGITILRKTRKETKDVYVEIDRWRTKIIMSKMEILQQNKFNEEAKSIEPKYSFTRKARDKANINKLSWQIWWNVVLDWIKVWILVIIWIWVLKWTSSIAEFSLLIGILWLLSKSVWTIREQMREYVKKITDIEKMRETFDGIPNIQDIKEWKSFYYKSWNIKLKELWFSYNKSAVFQNFNLELKWWTKTAFVGESWWWKTTLIKLLAGYIRPDKWEIEIDGQKLSEIKLTDYYKHIGYLTQDPSVFDWTIYENLVYALDTEPPKENLEKVVKLAKCEFIREFEKWLETEIGERWVRLSWWQKQRLAIAKIMLKNPNIILLDEPTSALDSFNEELINIALHNLFKGKTVIVVAHRLQTVKQADRILLFEQGKILEEWTHDELVKLNGKYKKMLDLQSWF